MEKDAILAINMSLTFLICIITQTFSSCLLLESKKIFPTFAA